MVRSRRDRRHLSTSIFLINFILLSSLCLTTVTISLLPRLPGMSTEEYEKLPIYCQPNTGYFECRNDSIGQTYCLPRSLKCRVHCSNNAALKCPVYADPCQNTGQFFCPKSALGPYHCIADHLVCDGRPHCPDGHDESLELCKSRACSPGQFRCAKSPGHCLPASMRCDGSFDCEILGLADYSDELNCPQMNATATCGPGEFLCPDDPQTGYRGSCLPAVYVCDHFKDCRDGADEANCPAEACKVQAGEFQCDGRCLKPELRCDGVIDCASGADEAGCSTDKCLFHSEFYCRFSQRPLANNCVAGIFVCDGSDDCGRGEDEVCAIDNILCRNDAYWTCKSGKHCIRLENVCDGFPHCPDGSDERSCHVTGTTAVPTAAKPSAVTAAANLCADVFGTCDQLCQNLTLPAGPSAVCGCLPGYRMVDDAPGRRGVCRAVGAAKLLLATETGIYVLDSETVFPTKLAVLGVHLHLPKFLEFDVSQKLIFFHTREGLVGHLRLDGPRAVTMLARDAVVDALAYDWTRRLLFFTTPEVAEVSGYVGVIDSVSGRRTQLRRLSCPRGLALEPSRGLLYISLWCGPRPGVYSMRMDGEDLRHLVTGLGAPGYLALDIAQTPDRQRLYWIDAQLKGVYTCRVSDGGDLRAVWHMGHGYDGIPLGLSVFEDKVMWSDLRAKAVYAIDKFTGAPLRLVAEGPDNEAVLSAAVYHSVVQPGAAGGTSCHCGGHLCINLTAVAGMTRCLCDEQHVMLAGSCVPVGNGSANSTAGTHAGLLAAAAAAQGADGAASHQGTVIAASVAAALLACLVCGIGIGVACLRRSGHLSELLSAFKGGSSSSGSRSGDSLPSSSDSVGRFGMPKINSRTPLTECEIGMEDQNSC